MRKNFPGVETQKCFLRKTQSSMSFTPEDFFFEIKKLQPNNKLLWKLELKIYTLSLKKFGFNMAHSLLT